MYIKFGPESKINKKFIFFIFIKDKVIIGKKIISEIENDLSRLAENINIIIIFMKMNNPPIMVV